MFGYRELEYSVTQKVEADIDGRKFFFEIRLENKKEIDPQLKKYILSKGETINWQAETSLNYIAIYSEDGQFDRLYMYKDNKESMSEDVEHDWNLLIKDLTLTMNDLRCSSIVSHHVDERTRRGSLIMH